MAHDKDVVITSLIPLRNQSDEASAQKCPSNDLNGHQLDCRSLGFTGQILVFDIHDGILLGCSFVKKKKKTANCSTFVR